MRNLSDTIAQLSALGNAAAAGSATDGPSRLTELRGFGSNPGALKAYVHVPAALAKGAALVVILHGCTQDATGYDVGSGWSELADRHGFALLFPEQRRANNPNLCFNWFAPDDVRRDAGEALSIRQMVGALLSTYPLDPAKVFVTGLSAGGAMTSALLATYPEVFAGGAIIAGLPYGCAKTIPQALDAMRGYGIAGQAELAAKVRDASGHAGPWPTVSVWHGTADATVAPANADAIVGQWRAVHGVAAQPDRRETVDGHARTVWRDAAGRDVIEQYAIAGMGHGTPLATGAGGCGRRGAHMLEAGISSSQRICDFWGLATAERRAVREPAAPATPRRPEPAKQPSGVGKVIEDALRAAGLMR